jgi:hypothetical protein
VIQKLRITAVLKNISHLHHLECPNCLNNGNRKHEKTKKYCYNCYCVITIYEWFPNVNIKAYNEDAVVAIV